MILIYLLKINKGLLRIPESFGGLVNHMVKGQLYT